MCRLDGSHTKDRLTFGIKIKNRLASNYKENGTERVKNNLFMSMTFSYLN